MRSNLGKQPVIIELFHSYAVVHSMTMKSVMCEECNDYPHLFAASPVR
jgi:hypothetical protein